MADRWAVASTNWSLTSTWDGGTTLPGAGDDVYADGFTPVVNQDVTVASIRNTQRSGGTAGGSFTVSATRTINADIYGHNNSSGCINHSAGGACTINGNLYGGPATNGIALRNNVGGITDVVNGNITGGSGSAAYGVNLTTTNASLTVNGNITGGASAAVRLAGTSNVVTVNGNATAGTAASGYGIEITSGVTSGAGVVVNGTAIGNSHGNGHSDARTHAIGNFSGSTGVPAKVDKLQWGPNGACPVLGLCLFNDNAAATIKIRDTSYVEATLDAQTPTPPLIGCGGLVA